VQLVQQSYDTTNAIFKSRLESRDRRDVAFVAAQAPAGTWVFLTNHAHVLLSVARDPEARARDIAERVGITERAAQRILGDLLTEGYLAKTKVGRRNRYTVNRRGHLRHPVFRELEIGPLLDILDKGSGAR
jgi:DNA-binding MarR family transcriptional regulator